MDVIYQRVAGLDVHKKSVMVCVRHLRSDRRVDKEVRRFGTMTRDILELSDWLVGLGVTHVAMESTGVFWKPIYNLLEERFELLLCNARHIKQVPGRKTDVKDCEWIAQLLQYGLLRGSFVPPKPLRELRDLTRHRSKLQADKVAVVNRLQKVLEDANVKLAAVATDVMGKSSRKMLAALVEGETDAYALAELAEGKLTKKKGELQLALTGKVTEHHRFQLRMLLEQIRFMEEHLAQLDDRISQVMAKADETAVYKEATPRPFLESIELLITIPGIAQRSAENLIAEIGTDMAQFPSSGHLASWSGMCPGIYESAGKKLSGKTTKGNRWLKACLHQSAWSAARTKDTYLSAQYRRLAARRGKKRAVVAVGHSILSVVYHILRDGQSYEDLGGDFFEKRNRARTTNYLVRRLAALGHDVHLNPTEGESQQAQG